MFYSNLECENFERKEKKNRILENLGRYSFVHKKVFFQIFKNRVGRERATHTFLGLIMARDSMACEEWIARDRLGEEAISSRLGEEAISSRLGEEAFVQ